MKETIECPKCRGTGEVLNHSGLVNCHNCGGTGKLKNIHGEMDRLESYEKKCFTELGMEAENPHNVLRWCFHNPLDKSRCVHSWFKNEEAATDLWKCLHCGTTIQFS